MRKNFLWYGIIEFGLVSIYTYAKKLVHFKVSEENIQ